MGTKSRKLARRGFRLMAIVALPGWLVSMPAAGSAQQEQAADPFKQAQVYESRQNYAAAESIYRKVLASDPHNPEALKRLGIVEQTELKFSDSIECFKRVSREHPDYPQVNFFLGLSYYGQRDLNDAIASLNQELKTSTSHPATRYYLALALEAVGRINDAIVQLDQVGAENPNNANVFYELARLHLAASFRAIDRLRKIDPDSFQNHAFMGELYAEEGHYEAAVGQYQAALRKQPDALGIHSPLGVAYWNLNQLGPAEKELLLALEESPDDPRANLYLGDMALRQQQFSKALPYLKRAEAGRPQDVESRLLLGRCHIGLGDLQQAKVELLLTVRLDPTDPRSHYMLAEVYQKLNQTADRQRELAVFNKLSSERKVNGAVDGEKGPARPQGSNQ
jgi:protein O-GlcNAc transferase